MALSVTSITPDFGPVAGGTTITITGTDFDPAATVTLGGVALESIVVVGATSITGITPANSPGINDLQVENPGPVFSDPVNFCYTGESEGWRLVRMFPGADTVLLSAEGLSILVPQIDEESNELILHCSDDAGETFTTATVAAPEGVTLTASSYKHFADATLTTLLFPNTTESLLSTDGGDTFSVVYHSVEGVDFVGCTYAAGSSDGTVLMLLLSGGDLVWPHVQISSDGGYTWALIDPEYGSDNHSFSLFTAGDISDNGQKILLVGLGGEGVSQATSTDGGTTWTVTTGLPGDFANVRRVDMTRDGSVVFASGYNLIYQSDDFGETWALSPNLGLLAIAHDAATQAYVPGVD